MSEEGTNSGAAPPSGVWGVWGQIRAKTTELESAVTSYLAEAPDNVQIKSKLAEWGTTAGKYLDAADERIGEMEANAGGYLKNFTADFKSFIEKQGSPAPETEITTDLFDADSVPLSRLDQQLHTLHTSSDLFSGDLSDEKPQSDLTDLLSKYPELGALHTKLVPKKLTDNQFWNKYEELRAPILEQDEKRKKILTQEQDDEDEGWGSSDEN